MRIAIREQLIALVILTVLVSLAIVSIPTWIYVNNFVIGVESDGLALTASLKAARIASEIDLVETTCQTISTRLLLQKAFSDFYNQSSNDASDPFGDARKDLQSALTFGGVSGLMQARLFSRNTTGNPKGLLNVTGNGIGNQTNNIGLPYLAPDGSKLNLSDTEYGYPAMLYPNITYQDLGYPNPYVPSTSSYAANAFADVRLSTNGGLLLGPLVINETYALLSITIPVRSNDIPGFILGYMTLVASAESLIDIQMSREGLDNTGVVLLIGSTNLWNRFNVSLPASNATYQPPLEPFQDQNVHFILPPLPAPGQPDRHAIRSFATGGFQDWFALKQYPAALSVFYKQNPKVNNATSTLSTHNEQGYSVAVGVARPQTSLATWAVVVEQDHSEAYAPISELRKILLGCVFGTAGLVLLLIIPCAHLSVQPIRRLKSATEKSILPPGYEDEFGDDFDQENPSSGGTLSQLSEKGFIGAIKRRIRKRKRARARAAAAADESSTRRVFKIPGKVRDRKHYVTDELTELTETFNEMTDELYKQYTLLDEKVAARTRELEISKKAAEAANESKTLFIANISHELKTPLNGIMGMCAVCMEEDDIVRIKQSLKTLYKSGDLLLHLLEDLLSFSKNQIGQQVSLEEREFRLGEIRSQIISIFDKQVRENNIKFTVNFVGTDNIETGSPERSSIEGRRPRLPALGPLGTGRLKDMCLWGDQHRILQVIINLVSNSLKFTPKGGKVELRIRCVSEQEQISDESRTSSFSNRNSDRAGRSRHRVGSGSTISAQSKGTSSIAAPKGGTALAINPLDDKATPHIHIRERSPTPPPANAKSYIFEFEVEDTGPGIAEHMQEKIFEPFVQGDLGLSKKFGGTGLGLSICSQLAKLMGGSIGLRSTVGVGTTFTMQIPLKYVKDRASSTASSSMKSRPASVGSADGENLRSSSSGKQGGETKGAVLNEQKNTVLDKQPRLVGLSQPFFAANPQPVTASKADQLAAIDKARANKGDQGKLRVLVADDNSTNIEVVSKMLKLEDIYDVTIAKDGQEAYDLVKANMENNRHFDVIFMDIQMPNLDGLQSTRLIRKMGYSAPIVALTAFSDESNVKDCMESGMNEFLSKPIRRPALKQVLKRFATIPEEPETASVLTPKTTPDNPDKPLVNGVDHAQDPSNAASERPISPHTRTNGNGTAITSS
ncbi:hypothetical protein GE09DRAFT_1250170 [Coniochaeta sp. 2T2.1]|nr:hypothetical protein GE09DRAFT_1250170 [Coniochaeta sp. 2T2.1]